MDLTLCEVAKAIGADVTQDKRITSVSTDTRKIENGSLFVCIKGESFDAHDFVNDAVAKGACAVVCEREVACSVESLLVKDTKTALLQIASLYREKFDIPVIGLTGSVGKTTTKEMIYRVMSEKYNTLKTEGNLNNEIGLPTTLFRLSKENTAAVIEMGMSDFGEISRLTRTAKPTLAVITNIGVSHIEFLGSRDGILKAKCEIFEGLKKGSYAVLNGDDDKLVTVKKNDYKIRLFGINNDKCDVKASAITHDGESTSFTVCFDNKKQQVKIPTVGIHNVYDALAAFTVGLCENIEPEKIAEGLAKYEPTGMRQRIKKVGNITVVEDCYNASPDSQKAAINTLCELSGKRKIAVLGDMLELGTHSKELHYSVGEYAKEKGIDFLFTLGEESKNTALAASESVKCFSFTSKSELADALKAEISDGDVVLFKASRGMRLEDVIKILYEEWNFNE